MFLGMEETPDDSGQYEPSPSNATCWPFNLQDSQSAPLVTREHDMSGQSACNVEQVEPSSQTAAQTLWSMGTLSGPIPNGFYSLIPEKKLKEHFRKIPSPDELHSLGMMGLEADIILVDAEKDKKLCMLKQLTSALVKGLHSNPASLIKKMAHLVTDFYKRPTSESSPSKSTAEELSHLMDNYGVQLLGQIKNGSCRPRAILFKVLADSVGLETKLVVGLPCDGGVGNVDPCRHMSVVAVLNSVELLVDLMRFPGQLIPVSDKPMFMSHISVTEYDSAEYDSCDSPLEPSSPLFGFSDRRANEWKNESPSHLFGHSPRHVMLRSRSSTERSFSASHSVPNIANAFWRGNRRKTVMELQQTATSSPEYPLSRPCGRSTLSSNQHSSSDISNDVTASRRWRQGR